VSIGLRRAYDRPGRNDGTRVLVDRVWPRGVGKEALGVDLWLRDVAPSTELRKWFGHDPEKWDEFKRRYFRELERSPEGLDELLDLARKGRVTLVFGAKDTQHNNAVALKEFIERRLNR